MVDVDGVRDLGAVYMYNMYADTGNGISRPCYFVLFTWIHLK